MLFSRIIIFLAIFGVIEWRDIISGILACTVHVRIL